MTRLIIPSLLMVLFACDDPAKNVTAAKVGGAQPAVESPSAPTAKGVETLAVGPDNSMEICKMCHGSSRVIGAKRMPERSSAQLRCLRNSAHTPITMVQNGWGIPA